MKKYIKPETKLILLGKTNIMIVSEFSEEKGIEFGELFE